MEEFSFIYLLTFHFPLSSSSPPFLLCWPLCVYICVCVCCPFPLESTQVNPYRSEQINSRKGEREKGKKERKMQKLRLVSQSEESNQKKLSSKAGKRWQRHEDDNLSIVLHVRTVRTSDGRSVGRSITTRRRRRYGIRDLTLAAVSPWTE